MSPTKSIRILAISDLHSSAWALERLASLVSKHEGKYNKSKYTALFMCGDIAESADFADSVIEELVEPFQPLDSQNNRKVFYIPGNMDHPLAVERFTKAGINIHGKVVNLDIGDIDEPSIHIHVPVAGFGYSSPTPFQTWGELSEAEIKAGLEKLDVDKQTILLTHSPPKGILDRGFGSGAIRAFVDKRQPLLHVFGHIHEVVGSERRDKTLFVNLPPAMRGGAAEIEINIKAEENTKAIEESKSREIEGRSKKTASLAVRADFLDFSGRP